MKILMISLGCDKNLVDSEFMLGSIVENGYELTDDEFLADIIVVNTCCFIHDAKEESIETILEMAERKKDGNCKALIVCGCLAQRYYEEIEKEIPEVDAIIGTTAYESIIKAINIVLIVLFRSFAAITEVFRWKNLSDRHVIWLNAELKNL